MKNVKSELNSARELGESDSKNNESLISVLTKEKEKMSQDRGSALSLREGDLGIIKKKLGRV